MIRRHIEKSGCSTSGDIVRKLQYVDRNVIHGTKTADNRWIVGLKDEDAYYSILRSGLYLNSSRVITRSYDSVLKEEYKEYEKFKAIQDDMFSQLKEMQHLRRVTEGKQST